MSELSTILIIEDDQYIAHFMDISLTKASYNILLASSAQEALFVLRTNKVSLVLLDLGLPDMDGLSLLREIRSFSEIPILVVSARSHEDEKIQALDLGANDYITKPFHMGELMARIRVVERFIAKSTVNSVDSCFAYLDLVVDYEKRRVTISGKEIHLTPIEYKTLLLLIKNQGKVLTHNYIIQQIWGYNNADSKSVRVFMANLRRKLEEDSARPKFILTEVGVGYRFSE